MKTTKMWMYASALLLSSTVIQPAYAEDQLCTANCVSESREGQTIIYRWLDPQGQVKKVFTVDLAAPALQPDGETQSNMEITAPNAEEGRYRSEAIVTTEVTLSEIVVITMTRTYQLNGSGGEVLIEVSIHTTRIKKPNPPEPKTGGA
ncbi:hypothetical protein [Rheinheimera texasensis]|uniref:hypothetical protein n=1 Tax=Rheinheimera texasensis TaxID=306205 RepID=UPI0032B2B180